MLMRLITLRKFELDASQSIPFYSQIKQLPLGPQLQICDTISAVVLVITTCIETSGERLALSELKGKRRDSRGQRRQDIQGVRKPDCF